MRLRQAPPGVTGLRLGAHELPSHVQHEARVAAVAGSSYGIGDHDLIEVGSRAWRHGRYVTYVVEVNGEFWRFEMPVHNEEGWQAVGETVKATQVHQVEKLIFVWEEIP